MDQTRDNTGETLHRLARLYSAPDFVKSATAEELKGNPTLPPAIFGDPRHSLYPLHTRAATWASYGFFLDNVKTGKHNRVDAGMIDERIIKAGKVHGIEKGLQLLKQAVDSNKVASEDDLPDDAFAIVWTNEGGDKERYMPMRNRHETVKAASYLHANRDLLPYVYRMEAAMRIREKIASLGVAVVEEVRDFIEKQSGYGACTNAEAVNLVECRLTASRKGGGELSATQLEMQKLAQIMKDSPAAIRNSEIRVKVATAVDNFDRASGLSLKVREGQLPRVEDVLFHLTREKLSAASQEITHTAFGDIYSLHDVSKIKLAHVRDMLGDNVAESLTADGLHIDVEKAAAAIPKFSRGDAELFANLMSASNFNPLAKQASSQAIEIEQSWLAEMAAGGSGW